MNDEHIKVIAKHISTYLTCFISLWLFSTLFQINLEFGIFITSLILFGFVEFFSRIEL